MSLTIPDDVVHTSEYVYLPANTTQLCHTANFQWTPNTDVHLVVTGECGISMNARESWLALYIVCAIVSGKIEGAGVAIYAIWHDVVRFHSATIQILAHQHFWSFLDIGTLALNGPRAMTSRSAF